MQATMSYVLSHILQNIPREILNLAFRPVEYNATIEQRIIGEIIEKSILLDTSLVAGKRRDIFISQSWEMSLPYEANSSTSGNGVQNSYYKVPPEAREGRNITEVIGASSGLQADVNGAVSNYSGHGAYGTTANAAMSQMLNSRTMAQYPIMPQVTLVGTNIICFKPRMLVDGCAITVTLEYDSEFLNMNKSAIQAMKNLCLCAVKRYIYNQLVIRIDETEVVAGMEIGVIKDIVRSYDEESKNYDELLVALRGASLYDTATISRILYHGI